MITTAKNISVEEFVKRFKEDFKMFFNVEPTVIYNLSVRKVDIFHIEQSVNEVLWKNCPGQYKDGIRSKGRQQSLAEHRQVFYLVAREMGYGYSYLAGFLGFDHATAIHAVKKITSMLNIRDKVIIDIYQDIKQKLYDKEHLQNVGGEPIDSESTISSL